MLDNGKRKGSAMNIEIAQRLYELRRKHGFSQESLAAELGLSRQAISKWERSESAPDMGNLIALADLYGMTIDELIRPAVEGDEGVKADDAKAEELAEVIEAVQGAETADVVESAQASDDSAQAAEASAEAAQAAETPVGTAQAAQTQASEGPAQAQAQAADTREDSVKQVVAHGHVYTRPADADQRPRCALRRFPYPLLVVVLVLILVLVFGLSEYIWLFLTIPFYYWIARVIERDPIFLERHGYASTDDAPSASPRTGQDAYAAAYAVNSKEVR